MGRMIYVTSPHQYTHQHEARRSHLHKSLQLGCLSYMRQFVKRLFSAIRHVYVVSFAAVHRIVSGCCITVAVRLAFG